MEIVHITFEKLTGLRGTVEGDFIAYNYGLWHPIVDTSLPVIFLTEGPNGDHMDFVFSQSEKHFVLRPINENERENYLEHFQYGMNFLIKEWSYGRGDGIKITNQNPN